MHLVYPKKRQKKRERDRVRNIYFCITFKKH